MVQASLCYFESKLYYFENGEQVYIRFNCSVFLFRATHLASSNPLDLTVSHRRFQNYFAKVFRFANKDQILLRDGISFHLSYQPPLYVACQDLMKGTALFTI